MNVSIELERSDATYTSGDIVHGNVVLYCKSNATLSKIGITLSGKSTSTLDGGSGLLLARKQRESHRFVDESQDITPSSGRNGNAKLGFGYHSFPFSIKIPWLATCKTCPESASQQLPPSTHDISNADITYKITATVTLNNMFLDSVICKAIEITVWPLDTSHSSTLEEEDQQPRTNPSYCRASISRTPEPSPNHTNAHPLPPLPTEPAQISIQAQLPPTATLTSGQPINMALHVTKTSDYTGPLYLQSFQMLLVGHTSVTARGAPQPQKEFWLLQSLSNIREVISEVDDGVGVPRGVCEDLWLGKVVPPSVVPSFKTCNVERGYDLEILMGIQCEVGGRVTVVQLCLPVQVHSGILPGRLIEDEKGDCLMDNRPRMVGDRDSEILHARGLACSVSLVSKDGRPNSPPPTYTQATLV